MVMKQVQLKHFIKIGKIPRLESMTIDKINFEYGFFLGLETMDNLYKANDIPAQSLKLSWKETQNYLKEAIEYLRYNGSVSIDISENYIELDTDKEERHSLYKDLGQPPLTCCPIYIITVGKNDTEKIVYIGKTSSKGNRFKGGHAAALKLHNPKYYGLKKNIYMASIMLLSHTSDYIPLEFISTAEAANSLLSEIESSLIYYFKPELNTQHMKNKNYKISSQIHIQNFSYFSNFLNDTFIVI